MKKLLLVFLSLIIYSLAETPTDERVWTSVAQTEITAQALALKNGQVSFQTSDGRNLTVPLDKLIPEDQQALKTHFAPKLAAAPELVAPTLPHPTGELVGPIEADNDSTYCLYLPQTLSADVQAPLLLYLHPTGGSVNNLRQFIDAAELTGMIMAVSCESKNQTNGFEINHQHTLDCLEHIQETLPVDEDRIFFSGLSGGGATSFYNADRIKCAGALPCVAYMPDRKEPKYGDYFYIVGGAKDFNRYASAYAASELGQKATHRLYAGGHGGPSVAVWTEGVIWLYTRELYENRKGRETELARFEQRFLAHLKNVLNTSSPHLSYYWADHLLKLCEVDGAFQVALEALAEELANTPTNVAYLQGRKDLVAFSEKHFADLGTSSTGRAHTSEKIKDASAKLHEKHRDTPEIQDIAPVLAEPTEIPK